MIDVSTITVEQFQAQFARNFPFIDGIAYNAAATYNQGAEVYYNANFYTALVNNLTNVTPTVGASWAAASDSLDNWVQDSDVTNAFAEAQAVFNPALYSTDAITTLAYLYCAAHFLAGDLKAALQGIMAPGTFPVQSRSVGSVAESYGIPKAYQDDPVLAQYATTSFGLKYLSMTLPALRGNVAAVFGGTRP